ncbi:MAG: TlpA family protein disulfide reductase [Chlorobium phaeobacteroides]|nr:TlpA family protein disulfide reductase [Chlorobium phaeobacteroides]
MNRIITIVAAGFMLLLATVSTAGAAQPGTQYPVAPSFSVTGIDNRTITSQSLAGKVYIVNFFASWCPPCRAEIPAMIALQKAYKAKGFTFVGLAVNESGSTIRKFSLANGINYPVALADSKIIADYGRFIDGGIRAIPTSFIVDKSGRVVGIISGARDKAYFEAVILDLLKGTKPTK